MVNNQGFGVYFTINILQSHQNSLGNYLGGYIVLLGDVEF